MSNIANTQAMLKNIDETAKCRPGHILYNEVIDINSMSQSEEQKICLRPNPNAATSGDLT
jgi:hypothetical protein